MVVLQSEKTALLSENQSGLELSGSSRTFKTFCYTDLVSKYELTTQKLYCNTKKALLGNNKTFK